MSPLGRGQRGFERFIKLSRQHHPSFPSSTEEGRIKISPFSKGGPACRQAGFRGNDIENGVKIKSGPEKKRLIHIVNQIRKNAVQLSRFAGYEEDEIHR
jgi:hypothetical protein